MTTKKKVGLAGVLGMQSRPVEVAKATSPSAQQTPTTTIDKAPKAKPPTTKIAKTKPTKSPVQKHKLKEKALPKSKDKDFKLAGVYLRKTTVGQVKARLELSDQDMSELVETLLVSWLKKN